MACQVGDCSKDTEVGKTDSFETSLYAVIIQCSLFHMSDVSYAVISSTPFMSYHFISHSLKMLIVHF